MGSSVIIGPGDVWACGRHYFDPIVDALRETYRDHEIDQDEYDAIFSTLDQGFGYICVDELAPIAYARFVQFCLALEQRYRQEALTSERAGPNSGSKVLLDAVSELLSRLRSDPRYPCETDKVG